MSACHTGVIAQLCPSDFGEGGGYGFIQADDGERLFFNPSGLQLSSVRFEYLKVGDRCRFTSIEHPKGPRAIEVWVADPNQGALPL